MVRGDIGVSAPWLPKASIHAPGASESAKGRAFMVIGDMELL
jgi:hypothetical protein